MMKAVKNIDLNNKKVSIMEYIKLHIQKDGTLPKHLNVNQEYEKCSEEGELHYVDGFLDGGIMYHCSPEEQDPKPLYKVIQLISDDKYDNAELALNEYFYNMTEVQVFSVIDDVQKWILDNRSSLDAQSLVNFAINELSRSKNVEAIKFSLAVLELFDLSSSKKCTDAIKTLALSNEFTLFCIFAIRNWSNKNDLIFEMAKKVFGWGRIFAVNKLEPTSGTIKKWLLEEGLDNDIMPEYSVLDVAKKIDIANFVKKENLTKTEYKYIGNIIFNLLREGPCPGISELEDKEIMLENYLRQAQKQTNDVEDYDKVLFILWYTDELEGDLKQSTLKKLCKDILSGKQCKKTVESAMRHGTGFKLARYLGINSYKYAVECIQKNPIKHMNLLYIALTDDVETNKKIIKLYEQALPLDKIATGPENTLGFGRKLTPDFMYLGMVLQNLYDYRGVGEKLIECALNSPSKQNRHTALNVIEKWQENGAKISCTLQQAIDRLKNTEVDDELKDRLKKL